MKEVQERTWDFSDMSVEALKEGIAAVIKSKKMGLSVIPGYIEAMQHELHSKEQ